MKKIIISILVMFFITSVGKIYAHEHPQSNKEVLTSSQRHADSLMQIEMEQHQEMEAISAFPNYHPLVVHFPIVLLIMALMFQILSFFYFKKEFGWTTFILLALGVIATWLSSNTFHAMPGPIAGKAREIFVTHERMANFTLWFGLGALLFKTVSLFILRIKWWAEMAVALLLVGSAITVSIAGHHGAMLVHMEGIGPMGRYLDEYKMPQPISDSIKAIQAITVDSSNVPVKTEEQEEDHHVGEVGKGPHGGTIEEADPNHMEIVADGKDLVFYLLDGDAKPVDMKNVTGFVKMQYADKLTTNIDLMEMNHKPTAMEANKGKSFIAVATLKKNGKSYTATFSEKDLPKPK